MPAYVTPPSWAPEGLEQTELTSWPDAEDVEGKLVRVFAYERIGCGQPTKDRLGNQAWLQREGKVCWARVDEETGIVWVRFDHLAGNQASTRVIRESRWMRFSTFRLRFPRAQMAFRFGVAELTNTQCTVPNAKHGDDDIEPEWVVETEEDHLDDDEDLDWKQRSSIIHEGKTKGYWEEEFGTGTEEDED